MDTVEAVCNSLARGKLMQAEAVRTLRNRWRDHAGSRADKVGDFKKWLVQTGQITDFQLEMLSRGFAEQLHFDDYRLLARIGKGRMAGVYKGEHNLGQIVAIKVLPPSKAKNQQLLGRFLRESRLAMRLDHPNVVRTFHDGRNKEGMYYIVMEFLDGETLEDLLKRRKKLTVDEAVFLMMQALEGLDHLDDKTVVHRDLKPANLMLVPSPDDKTPVEKVTLKILDIGLSRTLFDDAPEAEGDLTREGALLGTLNYMAPEQARSARTADIRADIYSLGCVFYEMLTGAPPFGDGSLQQQIRKHATETPRSLVGQAPGLTDEIDGIVQTMLAKDPALRYPTPGAVLKELRKLPLGQRRAPERPKPMRSFLTWLETRPVEDIEPPTSSATGIPVPLPGTNAPASPGLHLDPAQPTVPPPPAQPPAPQPPVPQPRHQAQHTTLASQSAAPDPVRKPIAKTQVQTAESYLGESPVSVEAPRHMASPPQSPPQPAPQPMQPQPTPPQPASPQYAPQPTPAQTAPTQPAPVPMEQVPEPLDFSSLPPQPPPAASAGPSQAAPQPAVLQAPATPAQPGTDWKTSAKAQARAAAHKSANLAGRFLKSLSGRDWICIASGAATILVIQWLWRLLQRVFG